MCHFILACGDFWAMSCVYHICRLSAQSHWAQTITQTHLTVGCQKLFFSNTLHDKACHPNCCTMTSAGHVKEGLQHFYYMLQNVKCSLEGLVHPKTRILSSFTHPLDAPNPCAVIYIYFFFSVEKHSKTFFEKSLNIYFAVHSDHV